MAISTIGGSSSGGLQQYEQLFTSSGTWTKPAGVKTVEVTVAAGGSTGVGAGGYAKQIVDVSALSSVAVTVGASGGNSKFGSINALCNGNPYQGDWYDTSKSGSYFFTLNGTCVPFRQNTMANDASMAYGNGIYVTVGNEYYGGTNHTRAATSPDGITWTATYDIDLGSSYPNAYGFYGLAFGAGKFVAVMGATAYYSTDGANWTSAIGLSGSNQYVVTYTGGKFFVSNGDYMYVSSDGVSWQTALSGSAGSSGNVAYNGSRYIQIFQNYGGAVKYSTDGISWSGGYTISGISSSMGTNRNSLTAFGGYFIYTVNTTGYSAAYYSTDGINWSTWSSVFPGTTQGKVVATPTRLYFMQEGNGTLYYATSVTGTVSVAGNKGNSFFGQPNGEQLLFCGSNSGGIGGFALGKTGNPGIAAAGGGAGSAGYLIGTGMNTPGLGVDGWCNGSNTATSYANTSSWGSAKNQGAVLVRWWA